MYNYNATIMQELANKLTDAEKEEMKTIVDTLNPMYFAMRHKNALRLIEIYEKKLRRKDEPKLDLSCSACRSRYHIYFNNLRSYL